MREFSDTWDKMTRLKNPFGTYLITRIPHSDDAGRSVVREADYTPT